MNSKPQNMRDEQIASHLPSTAATTDDDQSPSLNRADLINALNVMFPGLQLVCDTASMPVLDGSFSMFSESPQQLRSIFSSARKYRAEVAGDFATRKLRLQRLIEDVIGRESAALATQLAAEPPSKCPPPSAGGGCGGKPTGASPSGGVSHQLDKDYVRFVDELAEAAPDGGGGWSVGDSSVDHFRTIESLIEHLARASDEGMKTKQIAPFNSNLPVLNISECCANTLPLRSLPATKPKASRTTAATAAAGAVNVTLAATTPNNAGKLTAASPAQARKRTPNATMAAAAATTTLARKPKSNSARNTPKRERKKIADRFSPEHFELVTSVSTKPVAHPVEQAAASSGAAETVPDHAQKASGDDEQQTPSTEESCRTLFASLRRPMISSSREQIFEYNVQKLRRQVVENERLRQEKIDQKREQTTAMWLNRLGNSASNFCMAPSSSGGGGGGGGEQAPFFEELELQAMQQYRTSDESLERQFNRLELEAQTQYLFDK